MILRRVDVGQMVRTAGRSEQEIVRGRSLFIRGNFHTGSDTTYFWLESLSILLVPAI